MSGIMMLLLGRSVTGGFTEYKIFTASGNWTAPTGVTQVEYLVVAGGGSSGWNHGGGGGAGGFRTGTGFSVTAGTNYSITVGAGGAAQNTTNSAGNNGSDSVFSTITSTGGGGLWRYLTGGKQKGGICGRGDYGGLGGLWACFWQADFDLSRRPG